MFQRAPERTYTLLELDKINAHEMVALPEPELNALDPESVTANA